MRSTKCTEWHPSRSERVCGTASYPSVRACVWYGSPPVRAYGQHGIAQGDIARRNTVPFGRQHDATQDPRAESGCANDLVHRVDRIKSTDKSTAHFFALLLAIFFGFRRLRESRLPTISGICVANSQIYGQIVRLVGVYGNAPRGKTKIIAKMPPKSCANVN